MEKVKLKFGDIITYKNGNKGIYAGDNTIAFNDGIIGGNVYWKEVQKIQRYVYKMWVYTGEEYYQIKTIYEAKDILDKVEKEYLKNVIKPFKNKVKVITKFGNGNFEFITIRMRNTADTFSLPNFKIGTMYKGMKLGKEYTLCELELED